MMNIKVFKEDDVWITQGDDPDIVTKGKTILESLQNFVMLYEIEIDFELQREIFGY